MSVLKSTYQVVATAPTHTSDAHYRLMPGVVPSGIWDAATPFVNLPTKVVTVDNLRPIAKELRVRLQK